MWGVTANSDQLQHSPFCHIHKIQIAVLYEKGICVPNDIIHFIPFNKC